MLEAWNELLRPRKAKVLDDLHVALPRVRDFQGVKANGFDGRGNYTLGIT